jgi:hypothetical protein
MTHSPKRISRFDDATTYSMYQLLAERSIELINGGPAKILKLWPKFNRWFPYGGLPLESTLAYLIAYSGVGKSYCALNFFLYPIFFGGFVPNTVFFSMDMPRIGLIERYCSMVTGSGFSMARDVLTNRFEAVNKQYKKYNFDEKFRVSIGRRSIDGIYNTLSALVATGFVPNLVIIDHLQRIPGGDDEKGMSGVCDGLMDMVADFNCGALVVSQVARPSDMKDKINLAHKPPLLAQAKGSGSIDASADYAFSMAGDDESPLNDYMFGRVTMVHRKLREKPPRQKNLGKIRDNDDDDRLQLYYTDSGILAQPEIQVDKKLFT